MKNILFLALVFTPLLGWSQSNNFSITGKVEQVTTVTKAYLKYKMGNKEVLDSTLFHGNAFSFKGNITGPVKAEIFFNHNGLPMREFNDDNIDMLNLYLDKENIILTSQDSIKNATITGSKINKENKQYIALSTKSENDMALLNSEFEAANEIKKKDKNFLNDLQSRFDKVQEEKKELTYSFIRKNSDSYFSLLALTEIAKSDIDVAKVDPIFKSLTIRLQSTPFGQSFLKSIEVARATSIGAIAPVFTQNDVNDQPINLTDFKGKYVLLDFWASWCGPCRVENPNIVAAFKAFKNKNFTILGISLDQPGKKAVWLQAVEKDGLIWTQVSDLKSWDNAVAKLYNIQSIPQNYLIDPSGKIVGKNLHGEELNKKLATLLN